jgi:hypothetical protein
MGPGTNGVCGSGFYYNRFAPFFLQILRKSRAFVTMIEEGNPRAYAPKHTVNVNSWTRIVLCVVSIAGAGYPR